MRGNKQLAALLLEYARRNDVQKWSAWVELYHTSADGSRTHYGTVACWLPWNRPRRRRH